MKARLAITLGGVFLLLCVVATGCGSGSNSTSTGTTAAAPAASETNSGGAESGGAVPSEAESAATGDIPDNQTFLLFKNPKAGYSIRYPEGWARTGSGGDVTFREKANVIHVVLTRGAPPTAASTAADLARLGQQDSSVKAGQPQRVTINGQPVIKITYTRQSAPDPVTGKRLPLTIDRYVYANRGRVAVLDLATPVGVDNVDAYRMISESFRWLP